jgi:ATP-dependent exoDNAse (exonuclease V) beta subunit
MNDAQQRKLALDATQSFIVQAPAGSGKTELLIQRFLTLLNTVNKPEEILAITFTKKAANEMRMRLLKALTHAQTQPEPALAHAKQTWLLAKKVLARDQQLQWHLINNPNQLRIQTIDSLCAYLTQQLPLLSHFGSAPNISDQPLWLYTEAVQAVLSHVAEDFPWSAAIAQLLMHLDNDWYKLQELLVSLLAKRDQWLAYIQFDMSNEDVKKQLEQQIALVITDTLTSLKQVFPAEIGEELLAVARFACDNLILANTADATVLACDALTTLPGVQPVYAAAWQGLAALLLTKDFNWRKRVDAKIGFPALDSLQNKQEKELHKAYRAQHSAILEKLSEREDVRLALAELFYLPETTFTVAQWEILKSLLQILKVVAAQLRLTFQQYGQIDFIENAQAALFALGNNEQPTDLALALDYQIRHILIDEFQDTALTQYQLLEKLTVGWQPDDGRTLFVVGDPIQSIYRFREAEVGLFLRMKQYGIGHISLQPLTLTVNFRAGPHLVAWINKCFKGIFPKFNNIATGAVSYSECVANVDTALLPMAEGNIAIRGYLLPEENPQAEAIISLITELTSKAPQEKIAILVRSRSHLAAIIPALKQAKLKYTAVDIDPLAARPVIQDLLSLTRAMLHPADRIAWLAVLRAPWCGLTLADLLVIAGDNTFTAISKQLMQPAILEQLSSDGKQRLQRIAPILHAQLAERERHDLRSWIEQTWLLLGGPACLADAADLADAHAFWQLLAEFQANYRIINLDKLTQKISKLYASTQDHTANLFIMTIHTAKGLEFDTVILPHLERKLPTDDKSLLLWLECPLTNSMTSAHIHKQMALLLAPINATGNDTNKTYEYIKRQQHKKTNYEIDRLLYVAVTRARKNLYLLFNTEKKENGNYHMESGSFLQKLWPVIANEQEKIMQSTVSPVATDISISSSRPIMRLKATWQNPLPPPTRESVAIHHAATGFQLRDNSAMLIGIVTHRILQLLAQKGITWWQHHSNEHKYAYLQRALQQQGILMDALPRAIATIQTAINNTLADPRGQWIIQPHQQACAEFALTAVIENKVENLIIDRTFIDNNGVRWIIDYKTTAFSPDDLDNFLQKEQKKYLAKMQKYAQAMQLLADQPIRLGLYFPSIPAWQEWDL